MLRVTSIHPGFPSALANAYIIEDINKIYYLDGIMGPEWDLNTNAKDSKFK